ncbi:MAG: peptidylprolyl isomerase [Novosphingobium sp.]
MMTGFRCVGKSAALALAMLAAPVTAQDKPAAALAPSEIVAAAPRTDWTAIAPSDLLVMDLAPDAKGKARRIVIQLMPAPFSQGWIGNIRKLAAAHFWDGLSVNRVQDNYVVQWGDADGEDKAKARKLPDGLMTMPESAYLTPNYVAARGGVAKTIPPVVMSNFSDLYVNPEGPNVLQSGGWSGFSMGWPVAVLPMNPRSGKEDSYTDVTGRQVGTMWPVHCYGMVGVGRNMSPDTGSGAELYTVIGHAPRHLDRNIALVGRVVEGIEHLSSLPRGTEALGVYKTPEERTPIQSVRIGTEVSGLPAYEYLSTESESFARYADARANRRDAFFIRPAGGADVCNIPVPVRRSAGAR